MADLALLLQNAARSSISLPLHSQPITGSSGDTSAAIDAARAIAQSSLTNAKRALSAVGRSADAGPNAGASAKRRL
eukprot:12394645-Heterocapsa_arctica.AAC.1